MAFETNRYSSQRFGEDMRIPCTAEELEKFIDCYFRMSLVKMPNQQFSGRKTSVTGVFSVLSRNRFEKLIRNIHVADNLYVDVKTREDDKLWRIRPWLENLRRTS